MTKTIVVRKEGKKGCEVSKVVDIGFSVKARNGKIFQERQTISRYALLKFDWPDSEIVAGNLCEYMTDAIRLNGIPVASKFIDAALAKYAAVVYHDKPQKCEDQARIGFFVEEILNEASELSIKITDEYGSEWTLGSEKSFSQWLENSHGELSVVAQEYSDAEKERVRLFIYNRITPSRIKGVLQRREYDKAVVRGCLSTLA